MSINKPQPLPVDEVFPPGAPHQGPSTTDYPLLQVLDEAEANPGEWYICKGPYPYNSRAAKTASYQANAGKRWVDAIAGRPMVFRPWLNRETEERYVIVSCKEH